MFIPLGDDNPRATTPWGTWFVFAVLSMSSLLSFADFGLELSAIAVDLGLTVSSFFFAAFVLWFFTIVSDNVEDHLTLPGYAGFIASTAALSFVAQSIATHSIENAIVVGLVTATAASYAVWFPHHEIAFLSLIGGVHRGARIVHFPAKYGIGIFLIIEFVLAAYLDAIAFSPIVVAVLWGLVVAVGSNKLAGSPEAHEQLHHRRSEQRAVTRRPERRSETSGRPPHANSSGRPDRSGASIPVPFPIPAEPTSQTTEPNSAPLASTDPSVNFPLDELGYAVVRTTDDMQSIPDLGRAVASVTGEPLFDVTRRIRGTRGVLALSLDREAADRCVAAVKAAGVDSRAVLWGPRLFPKSEVIERVAWNPGHLAVEAADGSLREFAWSSVRLAVGYELSRTKTVSASPGTLSDGGLAQSSPLDGWSMALFEGDMTTWGHGSGPSFATTRREVEKRETFIELFVEPPGRGNEWIRLRLSTTSTQFVDDAVARRDRKFAEFLETKPHIAKNPGIELIANGRGRWSYLRFTSRQLAALYLAWLLSLVSRNAVRHVDPESEAQTLFLE